MKRLVHTTATAHDHVPQNLLKYLTTREHAGATHRVAAEHLAFPHNFYFLRASFILSLAAEKKKKKLFTMFETIISRR